jgi:hypothetical protein
VRTADVDVTVRFAPGDHPDGVTSDAEGVSLRKSQKIGVRGSGPGLISAVLQQTAIVEHIGACDGRTNKKNEPVLGSSHLGIRFCLAPDLWGYSTPTTADRRLGDSERLR